jgi:hypothetical protein
MSIDLSVEKQEMHKSFENYKKLSRNLFPQHFENCANEKSKAPINSCRCSCYEKRIFEQGFYSGVNSAFNFMEK